MVHLEYQLLIIQADTDLMAYFLTQLLPSVGVFGASFFHCGFFYLGRKTHAASGTVLWSQQIDQSRFTGRTTRATRLGLRF
jgi:hypothetical protein